MGYSATAAGLDHDTAGTVLLISANRCTIPEPVFPLGLACLNGALRAAGFQTLWYDPQAGAGSLEELVAVRRPDFVAISLRNIDDVLIRKQETYFGDVATLRARLRPHTAAPVVVGGSGFSLFPEQLLALTEADFGICGPGEASLVALLTALRQGSDYRQIPGLVYRENGVIRRNPAGPHQPGWALDEADRPPPLAAHYLQVSGMLNVQTQRGCPFRCCYCTYPLIEGKRYASRPADLVAEEFGQVQRLGARYVFLADSVFNSSNEHVAAVCEALLRRKAGVAWGCFLRPQGVTLEMMQLMARAGLAHIEFGSDSFCDEVLAAYGKDFTFEDIRQASEAARRAQVDFCHFLIAGGPGETQVTLAATFANSRELTGAVIMAVVGMRIYPGTALFARALAEQRISSATDLLTPTYYLAAGLTPELVSARLQDFARQSPNWIVGDPDPAYRALVTRLRRRGVVGPLWSYFAMLQRLWPQGINRAAAR
jgi:radical SAM superfamily enzyme YgiQ (UPF0313 family)